MKVRRNCENYYENTPRKIFGITGCTPSRTIQTGADGNILKESEFPVKYPPSWSGMRSPSLSPGGVRGRRLSGLEYTLHLHVAHLDAQV